MNLLFWKKKKTSLFFPRAAALRAKHLCPACEKWVNNYSILFGPALGTAHIPYIRNYETLGLCMDCQNHYFDMRRPGQ